MAWRVEYEKKMISYMYTLAIWNCGLLVRKTDADLQF